MDLILPPIQLSRSLVIYLRLDGDLDTLVCVEHGSLYSYVVALARKAPVTVDKLRDFGPPGEARFAIGSEEAIATLVLELMKNSLDALPQNERILVESHLFSTGSAERRLERASKELRRFNPDTSDTYAKNNLGSSLRRYVRVLSDRLDVFRPTSTDQGVSVLPRWFEIVGITWCLRLDKQDYRRQHWERLVELRSTAGDHPIVDLPQYWSGAGHREGNVRVISGQQRPENHQHRCLRVRPEGVQALDWDVYFFDLGRVLPPGRREILQYAETLFDDKDQSEPYIWQDTVRHGSLALLEVILDIPESYGVETMDVYKEIPSPISGTGYIPASHPIPVTRDEHGLLRHSWTGDDLDHESRYTTRWDDGYRNR